MFKQPHFKVFTGRKYDPQKIVLLDISLLMIIA